MRVLAVLFSLGLTGCLQTDPEPRALTKGNYLPLCLFLCEITTSITSSEGIKADGAQTVGGSTITGGAATGGAQGVAGASQNTRTK